METWYERIEKEGLAALNEMCSQGEEETLHLEFKTLSDPSNGKLTSEDRKVLAKAVRGFANMEVARLLSASPPRMSPAST